MSRFPGDAISGTAKTMTQVQEDVGNEINTSSAQLTKDIEEVKNESKKVQAEFESLYQEMEDLRVKYGLDEIATASETDLKLLEHEDMLLDSELESTVNSPREMSFEIMGMKLEKTVEKILNLSKQVK